MKNNQKLLVDDIVSILKLQIKSIESLKKLETMEMANQENTKEYKRENEKLNLYLIEINHIINNINCHPQDLEYDTKYVLFNIKNYLPENLEIDDVELTLCIEQIIYQKLNELIKQANQAEDYEEDYEREMLVMQDESYGETELDQSIRNQIEIARIKKIGEFINKEKDQSKIKKLIEYKYNLIRSNKNIADQLIQVEMNTDYLLEIPDDIEAIKNQISLEQYQNHKEQMIIKYIEDYLEYLELNNDIEDKTSIAEITDKDIDFAFIECLLKQLQTNTLITLQTRLKTSKEYFSEINKDTILLLIQNILNQRENYIKPSNERLTNKECVAVREETLTQFISLIKLAELIIEKHNELCQLEKQNQTDTEEYRKKIKTLENYLDLEEEINQNIEITNEELEKLSELLTHNLYLILKDKKHAKQVKQRLENMIPDLAETFGISRYFNSVTHVVHKNYHLMILKKFQTIIDQENNPQLKNKLIEEKYRQSAIKQHVNRDMVSTLFNPEKITILDDRTIAELLDISELEYGANKSEELYIIASQIMHEMLNTKNITEGYIRYQTLCLEEILNSINLENVIALEEQYNAQINAIKSNKKNPEKKLQLKPLFGKSKPSYLN